MNHGPSASSRSAAPAKPEDPLSRRLLRRAALASLVTPDFRQRLRLCTQIALLAFAGYTAASIFLGDFTLDTRIVLNIVRALGLALAVWLLRGKGSYARTVAVALGAPIFTFAIGAGLSVVRMDVAPMFVLAITASVVMALLLPWGPALQAVFVLGVMGSLGAAAAVAGPQSYDGLSVDFITSVAIALVLSIGVAWFMEHTRRAFAEVLSDAAEADEELARFHEMLENRFTERTAELAFANRELEGFSYTVSHDLRSPLRTVAGFTDMIAEENAGRLSESTLDHLARIRDAARRMDLLIDDMLVLARVGRSTLRLEPVDLAAMARSIESELRAEEPDRNVVLDVSDIPPVTADHALLHVAMDNLLRNAWKFTRSRAAAHIRVSGERSGDRVTCRVTDNGIGFDPRFRTKLFRPFERIHDDPMYEGTGVGLATVARVVHRHGGEVDAQGAPGEGATFSFSLPVGV